jgi:hypothetical protein
MKLITGSVGRGGVNRPSDVRVIQELLNNHIHPPMQPLQVDGLIGAQTIAAIEDVQRRLVKLSHPDGLVDVGGRTIAALGTDSPGAQTKPMQHALPAGRRGGALTDADFLRAATALNCEVACIKAVNKVESGNSGFLASGRPKILFEAHIFSKLTRHQYDSSHPDISSRKWNKTLYKGGEKEYDRLEKAMGLDRAAALKSASWGRFQIMGFHFAAVGYSSVEAFVQAMYRSEGAQLDSFVTFLQHQHLAAPLREKRWADFARGYNGAGFAANHYDYRLKTAYEQFAKQK